MNPTSSASTPFVTAPDGEQLAYATALDALLVSYDRRDYRRLHLRVQRHAGMLLVKNAVLTTLAVRLAIAVDWIAAQGDHRGRLFRWNDVQQRVIAGERVSGYTEEEHRLALGLLP